LFDGASVDSSATIDSSFSCSKVDDDNISIDCNEEESELGSGIGTGNCLLNVQQLDNLLTSTACCKHCVKSSHAKSMDSFVTFCESETKRIIDSCRSLSYHDKKLLENNNIIRFYEKWKQTLQKAINTVPLKCKETSYGLASMVSLGCPQCKEDARRDGRRRKGSLTMEPCKHIMKNHKSKSELYQYDINIRFCLALQLMGKGGEHARILTSFLDLPEPHKWPRSFSV
jgi:hypothetical protein